MPDAHAKESPSSLKTLDLCPHFAQTSDEDQDKSFAEEGTLLHNSVEDAVKKLIKERAFILNWDELDLSAFIDQELQPEQHGVVASAVKQVHMLLNRYPDAQVYLENRLDAFGITWGTGDFVMVLGPTAWLRDWKFGRREVCKSEHNLQLWAYVLGVFCKFPEVVHVTGAIFQPRLDDEMEPYTFTRAQIPILAERVSNIVTRRRLVRDNPEALPEAYTVSDACEFCSAIAECPRFGQWLSEAIEKVDDEELKDLRWPDSLDTPEERGAAMDCVVLLEKYAKNTRSMYYLLAKELYEFDGYVPVHRNGTKTIRVERRTEAFKEALRALNPTLWDEMCKLVPEERLLKLGGAVDFTLGKLAKDVNLALSPFITKGDDSFFLKKK